MKKLLTVFVVLIICFVFHGFVFADEFVPDGNSLPGENEIGGSFELNENGNLSDTANDHVHEYILIEAKQATCRDFGIKDFFKCDVCDKFFIDQEGTEILDIDAWKSEGGDGYIAPLGHDLIEKEEIEATCLEDGCLHHWECERCGSFFADELGETELTAEETIIEKKSHSYKTTVTREPSCLKEGELTAVCEICGDKYTETIDKTPHVLYNGACSKCGRKEDVVLKDGGWHYVIGNDIQHDYTGIKRNSNGWWRIVNGKVDFNCNSVEDNEYGSWYIENGRVRFDYTGIKPNSSGWWRIVNGKVDYNCNSVEENENGWWYCKNGKVQFDYTGVKSNKNGWWRIVDGKVDFKCNSVVQSESDWWYCQNGKVQFGYTGIKPNSNGWWRIVNGKVDFNCNTVEHNENGWWYCKDGKVQFDYTGIKPNKYGWWRIVNGKVDFNCNTVEQNESGWWYCKGGKVQFGYTGIRDNKNGWWRIVNGGVDFNANGVFHNENGWWAVKDGKVDFTFNGAAANENGLWYVEKGKVQFINDYRLVNIDGKNEKRFISNGRVLDSGVDKVVSEYAGKALDKSGHDIWSAYNWIVTRMVSEKESHGKTTSDAAIYSFQTGIGDCLGCASTFCWMARNLGYDCKVLYGEVPYAAGGFGEHAWCQIVVNGSTSWVDPSFARQTGRNGYMFTYGTSGTWVYRNWYVFPDFK